MKPKTFIVGFTTLYGKGMQAYLEYSKNQEFAETLEQFDGSSAAGLCSFYAKLCYKSLTLGNNANISKVRPIGANLRSVLETGHGSVLEHGVVNFVTTDCSRVFTHELVRHRVGTAYSQTSGRYVRSDQLDLVLDDPILDLEINYTWPDGKGETTIRRVLEYTAEELSSNYNHIVASIDWDTMPFDKRKKLTSALRRILPNGQSNEIGWSANFRALRHMITMRTAAVAEWEIRVVFNEVFELCYQMFPHVFGDARGSEEIDGLREITFEGKT